MLSVTNTEKYWEDEMEFVDRTPGSGCRRSVEDDRRMSYKISDFPLVDVSGRLVSKDRRYQPERRLNNVVVEWLTA